MIEKWKRYCEGSRLLAWLTSGEAGIWLVVAILSLLGKWFHFDTGIAEWLTLPSSFAVFLTRPWTMATYMGIHFDVLHMLFNVLWLYWFGRILLITLSDKDLAVYFFGGGICGGLFFIFAAAMGLGGGWLCGCSAAVIAVMCGAAIKHPDMEIRLFLLGSVKLKWVAIVCCLLTFIGGGGNQAAHIGGLAWGVGYTLCVKRLSFGFKRATLSRNEGKKVRNPDKMVKVLQNRLTDLARLDQLLDKIKISGYESLSVKERKELNDLSKRIKKE